MEVNSALSNGTNADPLRPPLPNIGGIAIPKTSIDRPIISGTGKATNFKFGWYIHRVYPNKLPLKIWRKGSVARVGVSRDCPIFWDILYYPVGYLKNG